MIPLVISKALKASPEGIRCCVARPPGPYVDSKPRTGMGRGITGVLERSSADSLGRSHLMFTTDDKFRIHFKWSEWQGLHIPSLGIFRS